MRIALLQGDAAPLDPERNLAEIRETALRARDGGAELLITPELYVTAYAPRELAPWLTPDRVSGYPERLAEIARETEIALVVGFPVARADGTFAIAAALWDRDGVEILRYEKVHLWDDAERLAFTPAGAAPEVAEWNGRKVALQICYDIEFPEPARYAAERGADLLLVPTAIDHDSAYVPEVIVRARAAENRMTIAYADHAGGVFAGRSIVTGIEGAVLASAGTDAELLFADLPAPGETAGEGPGAGADYLKDRRPATYANWT